MENIKQVAFSNVKPDFLALVEIENENVVSDETQNEINDFDDWVKLDLQYIDNWSLFLDLKILLKTIPAVLLNRGAK